MIIAQPEHLVYIIYALPDRAVPVNIFIVGHRHSA